MLDGRSRTDNQSSLEIGVLSSLLGIYPQQVQVLPDSLHQVVHVQVHFTAHHDSVGGSGQLIYLFDRNRVDLVVTLFESKQVDFS